jgi:GNAT superfamily N-acetyltransferase
MAEGGGPVIRIVEATEAEHDIVIDLVGRLLRELEERPEEFAGIDERRVRRDLAGAGGRFTAFLARAEDDEPVGVVTVMETFAIYAGGNYGIIDEMYVAPAHRSKGVGRMLIDGVKRHGRARGWLRADVAAPPEKRFERSVSFYERQGFTFTGPKLRFMLQAGPDRR